MGDVLLSVLAMIAVPVVVFLGAGLAMMRLTGRDRFRQRRDPVTVPLNFRLRGYDAAAASAYWKWLGEAGRAAERRFLEADMVFPLCYGGAMLFSLTLGWSALGRPFSALWFVTPVVITVVADWIENVVHWRELRRFGRGKTVHADRIHTASRATTVKLAGFAVSALLILALATWMVVGALR